MNINEQYSFLIILLGVVASASAFLFYLSRMIPVFEYIFKEKSKYFGSLNLLSFTLSCFSAVLMAVYLIPLGLNVWYCIPLIAVSVIPLLIALCRQAKLTSKLWNGVRSE